MAKITKEQIQKINNNCKNSWELDIQYFIFHNEKTLKKIIELDEEHYLEFKLSYNYKNQIWIYINKFSHKQGDYFATSQGLGKQLIFDEIQYNRKNVNKLCEYTGMLNDEELMKLNSQIDVIRNPIFVPSESF